MRDEDLGHPVLQAGQLACPVARGHVVPPGGGGAAGRGGVEGFGDGLGEFFEPAGEFGEGDGEVVDAGGVEPPPLRVEFAAQAGDLLGERAEGPGEPAEGRLRVLRRRLGHSAWSPLVDGPTPAGTSPGQAGIGAVSPLSENAGAVRGSTRCGGRV